MLQMTAYIIPILKMNLEHFNIANKFLIVKINQFLPCFKLPFRLNSHPLDSIVVNNIREKSKILGHFHDFVHFNLI